MARIPDLSRRRTAAGFTAGERTVASTEWTITALAGDTLAASARADVVLVGHTPHDALADLHTRHYSLLLAMIADPGIPYIPGPGLDPAYADSAFRAGLDRHLHELLADGLFGDLRVQVPANAHAAAVQRAVESATHTLAVLG
ncbi:hypothetical protein F4556_006766 [Kitasatospora gansuensis]|uniref:Uncharacterized protein n=1 Tax=Kitasatospora gansuensis TaxID=258050 RepID=A0A7W7SIS4_9ACTN|nr:hypothetical protein [Kitasatospora gansuensis]MBB4951231.1 hypothetical protein [Kitasatospora gansuensis]